MTLVQADAPPFTGEIHPAAAAWPMMPDDELDALADDIATNGQTHPIVVTRDGVLLDGRCRLEACRRAAVEPVFTMVDAEPIAYVLSANQHRRHITQGQRAMAVARTCFETKHSQRFAAEAAGIPHGPVGKATTVLQFAGDLVDQVLDGSLGLDKAYDQAKARKADAESYASKLARLTDDAPDLAAKVRSGDLDLPDAIGAHRERVAEVARLHKVVTSHIDAHLGIFVSLLNGEADLEAHAAHHAAHYDGAVTAADCDLLIRYLTALKKGLT